MSKKYKLPRDWRITRDDAVTIDAGHSYYSETILWHREPTRYGFLWLRKGNVWKIHTKRWAGWFGSRHEQNESYFRKLVQVIETGGVA